MILLFQRLRTICRSISPMRISMHLSRSPPPHSPRESEEARFVGGYPQGPPLPFCSSSFAFATISAASSSSLGHQSRLCTRPPSALNRLFCTQSSILACAHSTTSSCTFVICESYATLRPLTSALSDPPLCISFLSISLSLSSFPLCVSASHAVYS